ncbi:post-GPI attachment to proteins factor 2-like [Panulirus ornatus]|uniref:post-GPI attachment to proteins factor 2-like n=1 Tax=Panulirus ornatus TaxID=150431 RepID=UPI003A8B9834
MSGSMMPSSVPEGELRVARVLFTMRWRLMSQILLALPVVGMFICLITSVIFHSDHINNTICKVYNFLPSISAVTGVSPQRYLWRVAVALHISPRLLVAWVARAYYTALAAHVPVVRRPAYLTLVDAAFYLNLTELATLCGVTYISNKENYPVHEKLFTLFMLVSLVYMLCVIRVVRAVRHTLSPRLLRSFSQKKWLFGIKLASTGGLLFFFWRHRVYCQPMAFSWFSLCEYVIATCNMLYHVSVALDFSEEHLIVGHIVSTASTPSASSNSISTTASSSRHHSVSTPTTATTASYDNLAACEGPVDVLPTKNGRLDEPSLGNVGLGAPLAAMVGGNHPGMTCGKMAPMVKCEASGSIGVGGPGTVGSGANSVVGGVGVDGEDTPTVIHQVLNTIHEGAEPPAQPCLNGPEEEEEEEDNTTTETSLVHRRPTQLRSSNPTDAHPTAHAHCE